MKANIERKTQVPIYIDQVEKKYKSTFIGDFSIKNPDGQWAGSPVAVFYQPNPPELSPEGRPCSNYFGLYVDPILDRLMICDATTATEADIVGVIDKDGFFRYSSYTHDFVEVELADGTKGFLDGGNDYLRTSFAEPKEKSSKIFHFAKIKDDHLEIL